MTQHEPDTALPQDAACLKLADATRAVIRNCLSILGVTAPEKM